MINIDAIYYFIVYRYCRRVCPVREEDEELILLLLLLFLFSDEKDEELMLLLILFLLTVNLCHSKREKIMSIKMGWVAYWEWELT